MIVDSSACVPLEFDEHPLAVTVPMLLHVGGTTFRDGVDLAPAEFYRIQRDHAGQTSTAAPTPGNFLDAFHSASEIARSAICITVSAGFSSTLSSAKTAQDRIKETVPEFEVRVVDSRSAAGGQGLIAWEALKAILEGGCIGEAESRVLAVRDRVRLLAYVDTLYYLWKGGRVPRIAHAGVSILRLKPVFELRDSSIKSLARPRTRERAISKLVGLMNDRVGNSPVHAMVMHAAADEQARELRSEVESRFSCVELFEAEFTPVMGAHIGPGMVGIAFWSEP